VKLFRDPREERIVWRVRELGLGATARIPGEPDTWEGWEDSAVSPERVGDYLRKFRSLLDRYDYLRISSSVLAARFPVNMATDNRVRSYCQRCSVMNSSTRFVSSRQSGTANGK
jgi:FAD-dependent oxidoreductase family protein